MSEAGLREPSAPRIDIRALLLIALDEKPPDNLPDRVMARVAMLTTVVELGRWNIRGVEGCNQKATYLYDTSADTWVRNGAAEKPQP